MIREFDPVYMVDGKPMLQPDCGYPKITETDIDEDESGRDEAKIMHRVVAREGVTTWAFYYKFLDQEDLDYIKSLFKGRPEFVFTHGVASDGSLMIADAYRSKLAYDRYGEHDSIPVYKGLEFKIIER